MGSLCDGTYVLEEVLSEVFDKSNYKKVVFSDDASHIVFMKGKNMVLKNLISSEETLFINESYPNGRLFADTQFDEYVKIRNKINNSFIRFSEYE